MKYLDNAYTSGPYPVPIGLVFTQSEWRAEKRRMQIEEDEDWDGKSHCVRRFQNENGSLRAYICIGDLSMESLAEIVGVVAHEATHAWQSIRDTIRERDPALEQEAYAVQWISQWVFANVVDRLGPKRVKRLIA